MSYFVCDAGKKYYPFGRGGRENLLRGCMSLLNSDSAFLAGSNISRATSCASTAATAVRALEHEHAADGSCLPPTAAALASSNNSGGGSSCDAFTRLQHCPLHALPIYSPSYAGDNTTSAQQLRKDDDRGSSLLPVSITHPTSDSARIYEDLAKDVIIEVFRNQISTLLVCSIIIMRGTPDVCTKISFSLVAEKFRYRQ